MLMLVRFKNKGGSEMLKVRIETKNSAFEEDLKGETIRCINQVIEKLELGFEREGNIHDTNGNLIGSFKLTNR